MLVMDWKSIEVLIRGLMCREAGGGGHLREHREHGGELVFMVVFAVRKRYFYSQSSSAMSAIIGQVAQSHTRARIHHQQRRRRRRRRRRSINGLKTKHREPKKSSILRS